jgi:divinyl protochlorophyllide a 8-vinyl-reductase
LAEAGLIGPNAAIQLHAALVAAKGESLARRVFSSARLEDWLTCPPSTMVDERRVAELHQALRRQLAPAEASAMARDAGQRTADYIMANRIPPLARRVLHLLPAPLASRALLRAIQKHAWTFVGSGKLVVRYGRPMIVAIHDNPFVFGERVATPICDWHSAVFERLFTRDRLLRSGCAGVPISPPDLTQHSWPTSRFCRSQKFESRRPFSTIREQGTITHSGWNGLSTMSRDIRSTRIALRRASPIDLAQCARGAAFA